MIHVRHQGETGRSHIVGGVEAIVHVPRERVGPAGGRAPGRVAPAPSGRTGGAQRQDDGGPHGQSLSNHGFALMTQE